MIKAVPLGLPEPAILDVHFFLKHSVSIKYV
jgi:hypothetical protein